MQEPVEEVSLVRADDDEVGAAALGERDDRVGRLADLQVEFGLDSARGEELPRVFGLPRCRSGGSAGSYGPIPRAAAPLASGRAMLVTMRPAPSALAISAARSRARLEA